MERPVVSAGLPPLEAGVQTQEWAWQASGQASWVQECPKGAVTGPPRQSCTLGEKQSNKCVCGVPAWGFCGSVTVNGKILRYYAEQTLSP